MSVTIDAQAQSLSSGEGIAKLRGKNKQQDKKHQWQIQLHECKQQKRVGVKKSGNKAVAPI